MVAAIVAVERRSNPWIRASRALPAALLPLSLACASMSPQPAVQPPAAGHPTAELFRWTARLQHPTLKAVAIDARDGVSPDEIALLAVAANPHLRTLRDGRSLAHAQVLKAGLLPNPTVQLQGYAPVAGNTADSVVGYTGQLSWSIGKLLTRGPSVEAADLAERQVALDVAWAEWSVAMQAQSQAYQLLLLEQAQKVQRENVAALRERLAADRRSLASGAITIAQLISTRSALSRAEMTRATTRRQIATYSAQLQGLLGGIESVVDKLAGELVPPPELDKLTVALLADGLADRRPDLQALRIARRSQDAAFRAATRAAFPSIQLGFQVARDPGNFLAIGPTLQIGIPVLSRGQAARASARARSTRLTDLLAERQNGARQKIAVALATVRGCRATIALVDGATAHQRKIVELYRAAQSRGLTDILSYYAARTALVNLRLQRIGEQMALWQALVQLRSESGYYTLASALER